MKDMNDIHAMIRAELDQWFQKQIRNEYEDYYLYYLPTTPSHDGGISICKDRPANPEMILCERIRKDLTVEQNHTRLSQICRKLPILEY